MAGAAAPEPVKVLCRDGSQTLLKEPGPALPTAGDQSPPPALGACRRGERSAKASRYPEQPVVHVKRAEVTRRISGADEGRRAVSRERNVHMLAGKPDAEYGRNQGVYAKRFVIELFQFRMMPSLNDQEYIRQPRRSFRGLHRRADP